MNSGNRLSGVYFIVVGSFLKIGASKDIGKRLKMLAVERKSDARVLAIVPVAPRWPALFKTERKMLDALAPFKCDFGTEWHHATPESLSRVADVAPLFRGNMAHRYLPITGPKPQPAKRKRNKVMVSYDDGQYETVHKLAQLAGAKKLAAYVRERSLAS